MACNNCNNRGEITVGGWDHQCRVWHGEVNIIKCKFCEGTGNQKWRECSNYCKYDRYDDGYSYVIGLERKIENEKCFYCNGKGKIENSFGYYVECPQCEGKRKRNYTKIEYILCPSCKGTGLVRI